MLRIAFLLLLAPALFATPLINEEHGFRCEVPESLAKVRVDAARFPTTLHMFAEPERGGAVLQFMLLAAELEQGAKTPTQPGSREFSVLWKGYTLLRHQRTLNAGTANAAFEVFVDVPVSKRGIRIALTGPARREVELVGTFMFVLEHFEASTNWKSPDEPRSSGPPPPPGAAPTQLAEEPVDDSSDLKAGLAVSISLVIGFALGWWLRGQTHKPAAPLESPKPELPKPAPTPAVATKTPAAAAPPPKPPDETDPGQPARCRVCGAQTRLGKKKCMNCGSEIF